MKIKTRKEFFLKIAEMQMQIFTEQEIEDLIGDFYCDRGDTLSNLVCVLQEKNAGVTNGFLSEVYKFLFGKSIEFEGDVEDLYACPCCAYKTLSEIYDPSIETGYDICAVCNWEDDGTTDSDKGSGPNRGSMNDYRKRMKSNVNYYYREKYRRK